MPSTSIYPFSLNFTALASACLAIFVFLKKPNAKQNILWSLSCVCCGAWSYFYNQLLWAENLSKAVFCARISSMVAAYMCVLVAHFCNVVSAQKKRPLIWAGYGIALFFNLFGFSNFFCSARQFLKFNYYHLPGPLFAVYTAHFFFFVFYSVYILLDARKHSNEIKVNQINYILLGLGLGYLGGASAFIPVYEVPIEPFLTHFVWLYAVIITYAILKHNLMDIQVVFRKTIFYSFSLFGVSLVYLILIFISQKILVGEIKISESFFKINWFALSSLLCGLIAACLAFFSLIFGRTTVHKIFACFNIAVSFWGLGCFFSGIASVPESALFGWRVAAIGGVCIGTFFYHITCLITRKQNTLFLIFGYFQSTILVALWLLKPPLVASETHWLFGIYFPDPKIAVIFGVLSYGVMTLGSYVHLVKYFRETSDLEHIRASYFLFGSAFGFAGATTILFPWFRLDLIYPVGNIGIAIYGVIMGYAILRHQLLDIKVILKRTLVYSTITIAVSFVYFGSVYFFHSFLLTNRPKFSSLYINFIGILFVAATFKPFELRLNRWIERKFFKGTIGEISEKNDRLQVELERRERLKSVGILAAGMAHEIKNPLTAIQTFVDYLPSKNNDPEFINKFQRIVGQEMGRIKTIVADLLAFSKPSEPKKQPTDINGLIRDMAELLNSQMMKEKTPIKLSLEAKPSICNIDPDQIKQAILNIILNASEAMAPEGGDICIITLNHQSEIEIRIQDNGPGIKPEKLPHIFDPFFTDKEKGTGMGLAVTYSLTESNGGKINAINNLVKGTSFSLLFPVAP